MAKADRSVGNRTIDPLKIKAEFEKLARVAPASAKDLLFALKVGRLWADKAYAAEAAARGESKEAIADATGRDVSTVRSWLRAAVAQTPRSVNGRSVNGRSVNGRSVNGAEEKRRQKLARQVPYAPDFITAECVADPDGILSVHGALNKWFDLTGLKFTTANADGFCDAVEHLFPGLVLRGSGAEAEWQGVRFRTHEERALSGGLSSSTSGLTERQRAELIASEAHAL